MTCHWCCDCTFSYSFTNNGGYCAQCIPPPAANAVNPSTQNGVATYTWTCQVGYYGSPVSRTCGINSGGVFSGTAINCQRCSTPATPTNGWVSQGATLDLWTVGCNNGYVASTSPPIVTVRCDGLVNTPTGTGPTCSACGAGRYCVSGVAYSCPGGTFGSTSATTLTV
ncbi:hypothetical protein EON67_06925 [archaeon]|nr:MAG: hypothetical protein EON67_06925 [archaeon]